MRRQIFLSVECQCLETADKEIANRFKKIGECDILIAMRELEKDGWNLSDDEDLCPSCAKVVK